MKLSRKFQLTGVEEFSLLDTLQYGLERNSLSNTEEMTSLLFQIINITRKYNTADSMLNKRNLEKVFGVGTTSSASNYKHEFEVLKSLDFKVKTSAVVEMIYQRIEDHLSDHAKKDFLFSYSLDILRFVYLVRENIYDV